MFCERRLKFSSCLKAWVLRGEVWAYVNGGNNQHVRLPTNLRSLVSERSERRGSHKLSAGYVDVCGGKGSRVRVQGAIDGQYVSTFPHGGGVEKDY
jgi:hypothetical protein